MVVRKYAKKRSRSKSRVRFSRKRAYRARKSRSRIAKTVRSVLRSQNETKYAWLSFPITNFNSDVKNVSKCFRDLLRLPQNPYHARCKKGEEEGATADCGDDSTPAASELAVASGDGTTAIAQPALVPGPRKRVRRSKDELVPEKTSFFSTLVNLRACNIRHPENFAFHLTTDGVCARVLMKRSGEEVRVRTRGRGSFPLGECGASTPSRTKLGRAGPMCT